MSIRCGCTAEGDEIVFGKIHECSVTQPARADHVFELQEDDMRQRPWEITLDADDLT